VIKKKKPTFLTFPCEFPIKIIGKKCDEFEIDVFAIIRKYCKDFKEDAIKQKQSKGNNYLALTVTITAKNKKQLDNIYSALNKCENVVMTL
jgi:hypothetical protein